jgi:hypothetical protein
MTLAADPSYQSARLMTRQVPLGSAARVTSLSDSSMRRPSRCLRALNNPTSATFTRSTESSLPRCQLAARSTLRSIRKIKLYCINVKRFLIRTCGRAVFRIIGFHCQRLDSARIHGSTVLALRYSSTRLRYSSTRLRYSSTRPA